MKVVIEAENICNPRLDSLGMANFFDPIQIPKSLCNQGQSYSKQILLKVQKEYIKYS